MMTCSSSLILVFIAAVALVSNAAQTVTMYMDINFQGSTMQFTPTNGTSACYNLPSNWRSQPTSMTSVGGDGIEAFAALDCQGTSVHFFAPTQWFGDIWNDHIVSFKFVSSITTDAPPATHGDPKTYGVCKTVLIVDNYVARSLNATLTSDQMYKKYTSYFHDIDAYYTNNFNTHLNLSYIYIEEHSSFSDTTDANTLLNDFGTAINNKVFGAAMPSDACVYHMITGRQPPGTAGLAYVGVACQRATGWSVDAQGLDGAGIVLRRSIHEIGHNFGGNHPDFYETATPPYNCSVNDDIGVYRILRDNNLAIPFTYLEAGATISDCATAAMTSSMTAYQCLYTNNPLPNPHVTFYQDSNYGNTQFLMAPRRGNNACYNLMSFANNPSSIQSSNDIIGIVAYQGADCRGTTTNLTTPLSYVGDAWNDRIQSFQYIFNASLTTTTTTTAAATTTATGKASTTSATGKTTTTTTKTTTTTTTLTSATTANGKASSTSTSSSKTATTSSSAASSKTTTSSSSVSSTSTGKTSSSTPTPSPSSSPSPSASPSPSFSPSSTDASTTSSPYLGSTSGEFDSFAVSAHSGSMVALALLVLLQFVSLSPS